MVAVAIGLRAVLGKVLGRATSVRTLTSLTGAQRAYAASIRAFKANPKDSATPKVRSKKARQEDAVALGKMFLNYLRESIKGAKFNHTAKSPFTKKLQQARGNAQKPLWYTGEIWEDRKRGDLLVEKYTEIVKTDGGVIVGFRVKKRYTTPSNAYSRGKDGYWGRPKGRMTVGDLLLILEEGKKIKITWKMFKHFLIPMINTFYTKKEQAEFRRKRKEDPNYKKSKGFIVIPKRRFWKSAVNAFKQRLKARTNVQIESTERYRLKILVKN